MIGKRINSPSVLLLIFLTFFVISSCSKDCDNLPCDREIDEIEVDVSEFELIRINQENIIVQLEIDDEEIEIITEIGFVWSDSQDSVTIENATGTFLSTEIIEENTHQLNELQTKTKYVVRAYAKISDNTYYSAQITCTTIAEDGTRNSVSDIDGNVYETMIYGGDEWTLVNLKTTRYNDGTIIKTNITDEDWGSLNDGAFGFYPHDKIDGFDSDSAIVNAYGLLYNWYAVNDEKKLAPEGWHVASDEEWRRLEMTVGMSESASKDTDVRGSDQGAQMKIAATFPAQHPRWDAENVSNNSSGFSVVPGGARYPERGNYGYKGFLASFWTATEVSTGNSWMRTFTYYKSGVARNIENKNYGFNIRCVKNNL